VGERRSDGVCFGDNFRVSAAEKIGRIEEMTKVISRIADPVLMPHRLLKVNVVGREFVRLSSLRGRQDSQARAVQ
jgi:hypothetical protein